MLVIIKGAGDLASGIALRLWHCGFKIIMTDLYNPTSIRRTVCFSEAIRLGKMQVEDAVGVFAKNDQEILNIINKNQIAVIADPSASVISRIPPDVVVDAIIAKTNLGTNITEAPLVIGVGPGFTAGEDCHAVIETQRGHNLGKVIFNGSAAPNSGIPGNIADLQQNVFCELLKPVYFRNYIILPKPYLQVISSDMLTMNQLSRKSQERFGDCFQPEQLSQKV